MTKFETGLMIKQKIETVISANARNKRGRFFVKMKILFLFICSALLLACSVPTRVILINASTQTINISYENEGRQVLRLILDPNAEIEIANLFSRPFTIHKQDLDFVYEGQMPPEEYVEHVGAGPFF